MSFLANLYIQNSNIDVKQIKKDQAFAWSLVIIRRIYSEKCTTERIDFPSCIKSKASLILSKPIV